MSKKKTKVDRQSEIDATHGAGKIKIIGPYLNALTPVEFACATCGHHWVTGISNVCRKTGCPSCSGRVVTHAEIQAGIDAKHGRGRIKLIDTYTRSAVLHRAECGCCGNVWKVKPNNLLSGRGCPKCQTAGTADDVIYLWATNQWFNGERVYKIGVTGVRAKHDRVARVSAATGFACSVIAKEVVWGRASELEKKLLMIGDNPGYVGFDGASEFRALDARQLSVVLSLIAEVSVFSLIGGSIGQSI